MTILVVDHYDSFVYNLVQLVGSLGCGTEVVRSDGATAADLAARRPDAVILSPGPGRPEDAGATLGIVRRLTSSIPTLGVCLGHQAIVEAFGGEVGPARSIVHGKAAAVSHDGRGLFRGLPPEFAAGRYHSLAATRIPAALEVTARAGDGEVMAVRHRELPVVGVQFHPESVLTPNGREIAQNFLELA